MNIEKSEAKRLLTLNSSVRQVEINRKSTFFGEKHPPVSWVDAKYLPLITASTENTGNGATRQVEDSNLENQIETMLPLNDWK